MKIRNAELSDASEIARIHVETWQVAYAGIIPDSYLASLSPEERKKRWEKTLAASARGTRVAVTSDGEVAGWTSFGPGRDEDGAGFGELYAIYLDNSCRGKGLGKELLEDAILQMQNDGFSTITLWVLEQNFPSRNFYEKAGFKHDGTAKIIEIGGSKLIELRYILNMHK